MATGQYIGVNGVARKVVSPYVGVEGVARNVKNGYVGVDGVARLFFAHNVPEDGLPVILEVAKQTVTSYAGETNYENEECILLDIYPKQGGTVRVTYGGLTKTIKDTSGAEVPNSQQVFFGTFHGVTDSVATPTSGRLTIEGAYRGYGAGTYGNYSGKTTGGYTYPITNAIDMGNPEYIGDRTFYECTNLALTSLPSGLTSIGAYAFYKCTNLALTSLPSGLTSIGAYAFAYCSGIVSLVIPASVVSLEMYSIFCNQNSNEFKVYTAFRFLGTTPPVIYKEGDGATAFGPTAYRIVGGIIVPKGCASVYKAAAGFTFSKIAENIVEAS